MRRLFLILIVLLLPTIAHAASPVIATSASTTDTNGTSTVVSMPASIAVGDLLVVLCVHASTTELAESGGPNFTRISVGNNLYSYAAFARIATANASDALTVAGAAAHTICHAMRITGHGYTGTPDIMVGSLAAGSSTTPDPPNVAHGGPQDYLVLEQFGANTATESATYWSTNYSAVAQSETSSFLSGVGQYAISNTAENPGTMSIGASAPWIAQTYSIPPATTFYAQLTAPFTASDGADIGASFDSGYTGQTNGQIVSNAVRSTSTTLEVVETASTTLADAQMAEMDLTGLTVVAGNQIFSVFTRCTAPATYTCYRFLGSNDVGIIIQEITAGASANLTSAAGPTWAAGDAIRGIAIGTRLTLQRKPSGGSWASLLTTTDGTLTSGRAGLGITATNDTASVIVDNFVAYDTTAPAGGGSMLGLGGAPAALFGGR